MESFESSYARIGEKMPVNYSKKRRHSMEEDMQAAVLNNSDVNTPGNLAGPVRDAFTPPNSPSKFINKGFGSIEELVPGAAGRR
jgi:hypothetical protein